MSSGCSHIHNLGKSTGSEVTGTLGPSDIYCDLGLLGANMVMVDSWSHHPQGYPLWGNLLNGQIGRVVGPAGSYAYVLAPLASLDGLLWLGQWLIYLFGLS